MSHRRLSPRSVAATAPATIFTGFMSDNFIGSNGSTITGRTPVSNDLDNDWVLSPLASVSAEIQGDAATFDTSGDPGVDRGNANFITPLANKFDMNAVITQPIVDADTDLFFLVLDASLSNGIGITVKEVLGTMSAQALEIIAAPPVLLGTPVAVNVGSRSTLRLIFIEGVLNMIVDGGSPQLIANSLPASNFDCMHFRGLDDSNIGLALNDIELTI